MVRSLEPMAKKSETWARASAASAAAGTSIITPRGGRGLGTFCLRRLSFCAARLSASRVWRTSDTVDTMGSRIRTGPWQAARRIAVSCASMVFVCFRDRRMPRRPSADAAASPRSPNSPWAGFSPPTSRVRMVTGLPSMASTISLRATYCSSSVGVSSRLMYRNSVRSRPIPAAPLRLTISSSMGSSRLAANATVTLSRVTAGTVRIWPRRSATFRASTLSCSYTPSVRAVGLTMTVPRVPSMMTLAPVPTASARSGTPSTRGMPSALAMIAACPSAPPSAVAAPAMRAGSSCAVSAGDNWSAMMIDPGAAWLNGFKGSRMRLRMMRLPTSRTSSTRAAI